MRDHTVELDTSASPTAFRFAPNFNVAVPFIDRHLALERSDRVAIRGDEGDVTYGELAERVNRTGNALRGLGIGPGERILMIVADVPAFFYLFWGAIKAGIVPVPINTMLRSDDYRYMIDDSASAAVFTSRDFADEVEAALAKATHKVARHYVASGAGETLSALLENADSSLEPAPARAEDDCFWLYSSGSTGAPKGAVHAHRDMVVTSQCYGVETLGLRTDDVCYSAAKLFFAYGHGNAMTFPLWLGATSVLISDRPTPALTFETIRRHGVTVFFGVPTLYAMQCKAIEDGEKNGEPAPDLSSLRACVSAGEALPPEIYRRILERTGLPILDGIGSTEALHIFISNRADDVRVGTSGRLVSGYEARIVDGDGRDVPPGDLGRLRIRGDSSASRYWNNPEKTAATMQDGWLDTGDTYRQDDDGYYVYCGRQDDMLKVGGIWCSPFEIESHLVEHPQVIEAAVVGRADADGLIKPEAFIVMAEGNPGQVVTDALAAELRQHCKSGLARYKYPRWFNFVAELPKTATGKIQRFRLRAG